MLLPTSGIEARNLIYQIIQAVNNDRFYVKIGNKHDPEARPYKSIVDDVLSQCDYINIHGRLPDDYKNRVRWEIVKSYHLGSYVDINISFSETFLDVVLLRIFPGIDRDPIWFLDKKKFIKLCDLTKPLHFNPRDINVVSWLWNVYSDMFDDPEEFAKIIEEDHHLEDVLKTLTLVKSRKRNNNSFVDEMNAAKEAGMEKKRRHIMDHVAVEEATTY